MNRYIAFLRGVNIGGKRIIMSDLQSSLENEDFEDVRTVLASGNIIFTHSSANVKELEHFIHQVILNDYNLIVPVVIRTKAEIESILQQGGSLQLKEEHKLFVSFLKEEVEQMKENPYGSMNNGIKIEMLDKKTVVSIVNFYQTKTPTLMKNLDKIFGKGITTRGFPTIEKFSDKM